MNQQSDYFLWLTPAEPVLQQLQELINALARDHGGPSFAPHITLLSRLQGSEADLQSRIARLSTDFSPFTVHCPTLGWSDEYYRCVYLEIETDASLLSIHDRASVLIPHAVNTDFQPHISLMYGNLNEDTKLGIVTALEDIYPRSLLVDRMSLYHAPGGPQTWRLVKVFHFVGEPDRAGLPSH